MPSDQAKALECARSGQWEQAHRLVQNHSDNLSCLIHAYLHREEGDQDNARYWYGRAGADLPSNTLEDELEQLFQLARRQ